MHYLTVVHPSVLRSIVDSGCLRGLPDIRAFQPAQATSQLRNICARGGVWCGHEMRSGIREESTAHVAEASLSMAPPPTGVLLHVQRTLSGYVAKPN